MARPSFGLSGDQTARSWPWGTVGTSSNSHTNGILLAFAGVLVLSPDTLLMELDPWTLVVGRGLLSCAGILTVLYATSKRRRISAITSLRNVGKPGIAVALIYGAANILFIVALEHTYVANVLVIFATAPLLAAILSRLFLGVTPSGIMWLSSGGGTIVLTIVFSGRLEAGALSGDVAAVGAAVLIAANTTIVRRYRSISMVPAIAASGAVSAVIAVPFAAFPALDLDQLLFLGIDGYLVVPLSLTLVTLAPRYIPAPDVALIHLLETALAPIWVWLVLDEIPPSSTIIGGVILVILLAFHTSVAIYRVRHAASPSHQ